MQAIDTGAKIDAISRAQAVIELTRDGTILAANQNFLQALGYTASEIIGRKHCMFVDAAFAATRNMPICGASSTLGEFVAGEFMRVGKGGRPVHIQASYNPVFDFKGRVLKVVKFANGM